MLWAQACSLLFLTWTASSVARQAMPAFASRGCRCTCWLENPCVPFAVVSYSVAGINNSFGSSSDQLCCWFCSCMNVKDGRTLQHTRPCAVMAPSDMNNFDPSRRYSVFCVQSRTTASTARSSKLLRTTEPNSLSVAVRGQAIISNV